MRLIGILWTLAAWWFLASIPAAAVLAVIKARARGKRKFATEPTERVRQLRPYSASDHFLDAS